MEATRRSFLKGLFAVTAVATSGLPELPQALPRIVGDGVHDDWAGLQACFDGKPFVVENEGVVATAGRISGGVYRLSRTLELRDGARFLIQNATFLAGDIKDGPVFNIRWSSDSAIIDNRIYTTEGDYRGQA